MPFNTAIGSTSLIGFGLANIAKYIGTLWCYDSGGTATWATLVDWYRNSTHTVNSSTFPSVANPVVLLSDVVATDAWVAPATIDLNGNDFTFNAHALVGTTGSYTCEAPYVFNVPFTGSGSCTYTGHVTISE